MAAFVKSWRRHKEYWALEQGSRLGPGGTRLNAGADAVTSPPGALRRRHLKLYQRRALTLLAGCRSAGRHDAVVTALRTGFAAITAERAAGGVGQDHRRWRASA